MCHYLRCLSLFGVLIVRVVLQAPGLQTRGVAPLQGKGAQGPPTLLDRSLLSYGAQITDCDLSLRRCH